MLQFTYILKIRERVKGKCSRHPRYNPEKDGRAGIKGACSCCFSLYDLYQARVALDAAQREFIRRAAPWMRPRDPRRKKPTDSTEPVVDSPNPEIAADPTESAALSNMRAEARTICDESEHLEN